MTRGRQIALAAAVIVGLGWWYGITTTIGTPPVAQWAWMPPGSTAYMQADENDRIRHRWVDLDRISPHLQNAVILAEDDRFRQHRGIDWEALRRAAETNLERERFAHGGSTITMQLARNLYLSSDKSLWRKGREMLIALKLERELSKDRILELYLNSVEWGNGIYGADAAARHYFGRSAAGLSKEQAAFLAAILPRPRYYDRNRNGEYLQNRIATIAGRL